MSEINQNELAANELKKVSAGTNKANGYSLVTLYCGDCGATMGGYSSLEDARQAESRLNGECTKCGGRLKIRDEWIE